MRTRRWSLMPLHDTYIEVCRRCGTRILGCVKLDRHTRRWSAYVTDSRGQPAMRLVETLDWEAARQAVVNAIRHVDDCCVVAS